MSIDSTTGFTLLNLSEVTDQRDSKVDQVPFFIALAGPRNLRTTLILEAILAANEWTVQSVSAGASYTVDSGGLTDHVLLVDTTSGNATITLPTAAAAFSSNKGRVLFIKDKSGNAEEQSIKIDADGSETIDGKLTISMRVDYGAIAIISSGTEWHTVMLL